MLRLACARATLAEDNRSPGLNFRAGEEELRVQFLQGLLDQIVTPHRDSAGHQQQVRRHSLFDQSAQPVQFVRGYGQKNGFTPRAANLHGQGITIRVANLSWARSGLDAHNLVPGCEHGNSWELVHLQSRFADRCGQRDSHLIQTQAVIQQHRAFASLGAAGNNVLARRNAPRDLDLFAVLRGVLDHHHRIRPSGHGRAGHNRCALSGADVERNPVKLSGRP